MSQQNTAIYPNLKDRVVFVTGGATGIGASIVEHFCAQGSKVSFVDINKEAGVALVKTMAGKGYAAPRFIECDITNVENLQSAIADVIATDGAILTLVNNAANDDRHKLEDVTSEYSDDRMAINIKHQLFATQAVAGPMADAGGGTIINIGSITYIIGQGGMPCYSLAKSAVIGLTRSLAADLGPKNIRVNVVIPGWIITERQQDLWLTAESEADILEKQCIKRLLRSEDVAGPVLFLASDNSAGCAAQSFIVDGGWS